MSDDAELRLRAASLFSALLPIGDADAADDEPRLKMEIALCGPIPSHLLSRHCGIPPARMDEVTPAVRSVLHGPGSRALAGGGAVCRVGPF